MTRKWLCLIGFALLVLWIAACVSPNLCDARKPGKIVIAYYASAEGEQLTARFDIDAKTVTVERPGKKTRTLPLAVSASGARYSNGEMTFWEHQGTATLFRGDSIVFTGKESSAPEAAKPAAKKHKRQRPQN